MEKLCNQKTFITINQINCSYLVSTNAFAVKLITVKSEGRLYHKELPSKILDVVYCEVVIPSLFSQKLYPNQPLGSQFSFYKKPSKCYSFKSI